MLYKKCYISINKKTLILFCLLLPYTLFQFLGDSKIIWFISRFLSYVGIVYILLVTLKKMRVSICINALIIIQLLYSVFQYYSTYRSGGNLAVDYQAIKNEIISLLTLTGLLNLYRKNFLRVLNAQLVGLYVINFISIGFNIISYKTINLNADVKCFLGYRYIFCIYSMLMIMVAYYCKDFSKKETLLYKIAFLLTLCTSLTIGPSTLLGGLILWATLIWSRRSGLIKRKSLNVWVLIGIAITFNIGIVLFNIQNLFSFILSAVLNRDATFTGRTKIWETAIQAFLCGNIWTGLGNSLAFGYEGWGNLGWEVQKYSCHNQILTYVTNTGIIGCTIEVFFILLVAQKLWKYRKTRMGYFYTAGFISILIMSISTQLLPYLYFELFCIIIYQFDAILPVG